MSLREDLQDFGDSIGAAGSNAPDEYPEWAVEPTNAHGRPQGAVAAIRLQIKQDLVQAGFVDVKLQEMFAAFDAGEKDKGRKAAWALYNADVTKLR